MTSTSETPAGGPGVTPRDRFAPARKALPWGPAIYAVGFVVLAAAIVYLWQNPSLPEAPTRIIADQSGLESEVSELHAELVNAQKQIATLASRPIAGQPADLGALERRVAALEARPAATGSGDTAPADVAGLTAQIAAQQDRLTSLSQNLADLTKAAQADHDLASRVDDLQGKLAAADKQSAEVSGAMAGLSDRAARAVAVQGATAALASGRPLGHLPDAPPALARFADTAPPTEAALRLAYPAAATRALAAAAPPAAGLSFAQRMWVRTQQLITVREGDHVIVGNPAAGILARAQTTLDAGDLAGAVAALAGLPPEAAAPLADWQAQAKALLAARAALADMAAHAASADPAAHAAQPDPAAHAAQPDPAAHAAQPDPAAHAAPTDPAAHG